ncbi:MAG: serine/threonine-protein kinase, partial [Gemmatimonadales bacterium]
MPAQGGSVHQHHLRSFEAELADRYRIERELGRGGMATVYLAHDLKHDRPVALKVLRPEIAAVLGTERFLREIRIAARLSHHNILPLYDSAAAAGMLFYVMPYVEGGTLMERLARGPRPSVAEALGITRQIAEGLAYAHMIDVIHRDIKPANILMASGHVFIADFGIARAIRRGVTQDGITSSGFVLGTPSYMAPEQLTGAGQIDGRADEYSLACVLCEMLLGHPPSHGSQGPSSLRRAMHQVRPEVPAAVGAALERALSPDPSERFPGAAEFAAALDTATVEDMPSLGESGGRASRVSRAMALGVGATILLLTLWAIIGPGRSSSVTTELPLDTSRYAVLPFEYQAGIDETA